jgi:predicted acetyltransferase
VLELVERCPALVGGYRDYCREAYAHRARFFVPSDPARIDDGWFARTKGWYDRKERGLVPGQPAGFHRWAVDGALFVGEFQLRTALTEEVMNGIGSVGYAVRVSLQGRGYGTELLRRGLDFARRQGMTRVLLNISADNAVSIHVCEKLGGVLMDTIRAHSAAEGDHLMRRYFIGL